MQTDSYIYGQHYTVLVVPSVDLLFFDDEGYFTLQKEDYYQSRASQNNMDSKGKSCTWDVLPCTCSTHRSITIGNMISTIFYCVSSEILCSRKQCMMLRITITISNFEFTSTSRIVSTIIDTVRKQSLYLILGVNMDFLLKTQQFSSDLFYLR